MKPDEKYSIPRFALYGDDNQHLQPDFVHIEDIADRSLKHDWRIKPHRHGKLFQLLFLDNGRAELCLDEENHRLNGNWIITIPPGTVHGFCFPADTEGMVLTMLDTLVEDRDPNMHSFLSQLLLQPYRLKLHSSDVLFRQLLQYLRHIKQELNSTHYGQVQMLKYLVKMVLINISRQLESHPQSEHSNNGRQQLLNQFRHLLETNYPQHWTVQQYAQSLHTSTSSLNRVCLELLGVTAKELIQDRMLIEIKRRLIYTRQPLDSIAYTLGYKDPSYFSRFFKNREGVSPGHYRQQKYHETETS